MANKPSSQLSYARIQDGSGSPRVITLHKHNQFADGVAGAATTAFPGARIIGLESYKGVYVGRTIVGYTWYVGPIERPAPLFFGDSLAEIERFLWDDRSRNTGETDELPFLLGVEQGAVMAIAAAAAVPDCLSGVIAIDGFLPVVPGWNPPLAPLECLPILLVEPRELESSESRVMSGGALVETLKSWGGSVEVLQDLEETSFNAAIRDWIGRHPPRAEPTRSGI